MSCSLQFLAFAIGAGIAVALYGVLRALGALLGAICDWALNRLEDGERRGRAKFFRSIKHLPVDERRRRERKYWTQMGV